MGRNRINTVNIFSMIPHRIRNWEKQSNQTVHVLYPRFPCWPFRWLMKYVKKPFIHLRLDTTGSKIWEMIDGNRNVLAISVETGQSLQQELTEDWHKRVASFIQYLQRGDLICLKANQSDI